MQEDIHKSPTSHKLRKVTEGLSENHIAVLCNAFLKLLLQVTTAVLVFAQGRNFTLEVFQMSASKSVD
jgi:hypothetical protein